MDAAERADTLLAQLDALIAMGRLDAARELGVELRARLREATSGPGPIRRPDRRDIVLAPLADLLRRLRALLRDLPNPESPAGPLLARFQDLVDGLDPLRDGPAARTAPLSPLRSSLRELTQTLEESLTHLRTGDREAAVVVGEAGVQTLLGAMRWVDEAMGSPSPSAEAPHTFVSRYLARRMPSWELPGELSLAMHAHISEAAPEHKRTLLRVSRQLSEPREGEAKVTLRGGHGLDEGKYRAIVVPVHLEDGSRYVCALSFLPSPDGTRPAPLPFQPIPYGARAEALLQCTLDEAQLAVLRLHDDGPHRGLLASARPAELSAAAREELATHYRAGAARPSPVQAEVLAWIESLGVAEDGPIPEADLRQLGIPWYEPSDLADLLRPVHEDMEYLIVDPGEHVPEFPGFVWQGGDDAALVQLTLGDDGATPTIVVPRQLLRYLGWLLARETRDDQPPDLAQLTTAIQLHLGVKLAFFDRLLDAGDEAAIDRAALAVERAYLASVGAPPDALRDMLTRIVTRHREALEAPAGETPIQRFSRKASDLFEARAGEEFVKSGLIPLSVLFSSYRHSLQLGLANRGRTRAARSANFLADFEDAGVLFGNLVSDPATGMGVLIVGDSKVGKSSVMARLVAGAPGRGQPDWSYHASDRVLVLMPKEGPPLAFPSPAHRTFGQWTQELWFRDANHREIRPPDQVPVREMVPLGAIVVLRRDAGPFASRGLAPRSLMDLVEDSQSRFGFYANTRFWSRLAARVAALDVALARRGSDTFFDAAERVRSHVATTLAGLGRMPLRVVEADAWYGVQLRFGLARVTRIGADGIDVDYELRPDGSVACRPSQLGQSAPLCAPGRFELPTAASVIPLDPERVEQHGGRPHYRLARGRAMPLSSEYFRDTFGGDRFVVPALPDPVLDALGEAMSEDWDTWGGWLEET